MRIRKQYQTIPTNAKLENAHSTSNKNGYVCEYINNEIEWKLLGGVTGSTDTIDLPSDFKELYIITLIEDGRCVTTTLLKESLSSNIIYPAGAFYLSANSNYSAQWDVNLSRIKLATACRNGTEKTSIAVTTVYYR